MSGKPEWQQQALKAVSERIQDELNKGETSGFTTASRNLNVRPREQSIRGPSTSDSRTSSALSSAISAEAPGSR